MQARDTASIESQPRCVVLEHTEELDYSRIVFDQSALVLGDARTVLRAMPARCVQTVVTSAPYWSLRDYGIEGQIGLEDSVYDFVEHPADLFDDVTLQPLDAVATSDFYDLVVERHRRAATAFTSNRDTSERLAVMADPLLAQSAIDRVTSAAWELVIDGESYRKREKPTLGTPPNEGPQPRQGRRWS